MVEKIKLKFGSSSGQPETEVETSPITVFVGPNNSGKSKVLMEIEQFCKESIINTNNLILEDIDFTSLTDVENEIAIHTLTPLVGELVQVNCIIYCTSLMYESPPQMSEFKKHIVDNFGFTESELLSIADFFQKKEIPKGEYFLKEGQIVRNMGFVEQGILREYVFVQEKEVTKWFATPGHFAVDLSGFLFDQKSKVNLQAISDVQLWTISKDDCNQIATKVPRWDKLEKMFLANCFGVLESRVSRE